VDTSRASDLGYTEGSLPAEGEFVSTLSCEHPLEHQIIHLELSATHEPFMIAPEHLMVPCILHSKLPPSLFNEVDIFMPELVLRSCGAHDHF
jgi:hypothetical protein